MELSSLSHPLVKHWTLLRKSPSYRKETKKLLIIGEKIAREFPFFIIRIISEKSVNIPAEMQVIVPQHILQTISGIKGFDGVIAEVHLPQEQTIDDQKYVLILDQIQDPGNLGTLVRTCTALGWEGIIATHGTADFYNDKAIRASSGSIFRIPFCYRTPDEIISWANKTNRTLFLADMNGSDVKEIESNPPLGLILSNEGTGALPWAKKIGKTVSVPLQNNVESLNVSIAGAILLYQMKKT